MTNITLANLSINSKSTAMTGIVFTTSTNVMYITCDDMSKMVIFAYNNDTAAATVTFSASDSEYIGKGISPLTTSLATKEYAAFGPFESYIYKSSSGTIEIAMTSTATTSVSFWAMNLP